MTRYNTFTNGQSIVVTQIEKENTKKQREELLKVIIQPNTANITNRTSITSTKENLNARMTKYKT